MDVIALLQEPGRKWHARPSATHAELQRLSSASPVPLPSVLLDFLRVSNGGEGPLALPPLVFMLDDVDFIIGNLEHPSVGELYPGLIFFGGNGGLERMALDTRGGRPPWPVVMIDLVAGHESAVKIADDFEQFVEAVGRSVREA